MHAPRTNTDMNFCKTTFICHQYYIRIWYALCAYVTWICAKYLVLRLCSPAPRPRETATPIAYGMPSKNKILDNDIKWSYMRDLDSGKLFLVRLGLPLQLVNPSLKPRLLLVNLLNLLKIMPLPFQLLLSLPKHI